MSKIEVWIISALATAGIAFFCLWIYAMVVKTNWCFANMEHPHWERLCK